MPKTKLKYEQLLKAKEICGLEDVEVEECYVLHKNKQIKCYYFIINHRQEVVFDINGNILLTSKYKKISDYAFHRILGYKNEFMFYNDFVVNLITKLDNYNKLLYEIEIKTYDNKKYYTKELTKYDNFKKCIKEFSNSLDENLNY